MNVLLLDLSGLLIDYIADIGQKVGTSCNKFNLMRSAIYLMSSLVK